MWSCTRVEITWTALDLEWICDAGLYSWTAAARGELTNTGEPGVGDALTCDHVTGLNWLELHWIRVK